MVSPFTELGALLNSKGSMLQKRICLLLFFFIFGFSLAAQAGEDLIPRNSRIFIVPMESSLDQFLAAEILKQKVPIAVVTDEKLADYVISGTAVKKDGSNKWYHYLSGTAGTTDSMQSSISLVNRREKRILWAANAGDRSIFWGTLRRGGERKIAQKLVKSFKKEIFKGKA